MQDLAVTDALALLRLYLEWGADEALDEHPHRWLSAPSLAPVTRPAPPAVDAGRPETIAAVADSIDKLGEAIRAFTGCALRDTASHTILAEGDPSAGLMLVGEVPDADEDRAGRVFAGEAGALLDRMLTSIGLSRADLLIAPLIPWRPPGDRRVNPHEMAACLPFLHRLIALAQPRYLLLMGTRPARALLASEAPLSRLRGRWMPGTPQMLAMRHPAQLPTMPAARREAWQDLLLLRTTLDITRG